MKVQTNPYDYEAHVRYIAALRQAFDFEELTAAREQMSTLFPLSPGVCPIHIRKNPKAGVPKTIFF